MVKTVVLGQGALEKQVNLQRRSTGSAPGEYWSIDRGQFRVGGTATLRIDGTGGLDGDGKFVWRGPADFNGDVKITKTLDVAAQTKLRGALELLADMVVSAGGKITVGAVTIDPAGGGKVVVAGTDPMTLGLTSAGRPGIQFATGSQVVGTADGTQLNNAAGNGFVFAGATVGMSRGGKGIRITTAGITADAPFNISSLPVAPTGTTVYMVVVDAAGNLYRKATAA